MLELKLSFKALFTLASGVVIDEESSQEVDALLQMLDEDLVAEARWRLAKPLNIPPESLYIDHLFCQLLSDLIDMTVRPNLPTYSEAQDLVVSHGDIMLDTYAETYGSMMVDAFDRLQDVYPSRYTLFLDGLEDALDGWLEDQEVLSM